jgi:hypothetical protein
MMMFFISCQQNHKKDLKNAEMLDTISSQNTNSENFTEFITIFNRDTNFQIKRISFPLITLNISDPMGNFYDTIYIEKNQYEFIQLTEPKSNIYDGIILLSTDKIDDSNIKITLIVDETGIQIQYFFKKINGKWFLICIKDVST